MAAIKRFSVRVAPGDDPGPAIVAAGDAARAFVADHAIPEASAARLLVCVDELVSNVLRHGACDRDACVTLELRREGDGIELAITDDCPPFDPLARPAFSGPDAASGGGVGLELVRRWAHGMTYERAGEENRLVVRLRAED